MKKYLYVLYSNTSRNSMAGLRPKVTWMSDKDIVEAAAFEMRRSGMSLEDMAGIEWIEGSEQYARELDYDEVIALSIEKMGDDGRLFRVFTEPEGFIEAAQAYGLEDEARDVAKKIS